MGGFGREGDRDKVVCTSVNSLSHLDVAYPVISSREWQRMTSSGKLYADGELPENILHLRIYIKKLHTGMS